MKHFFRWIRSSNAYWLLVFFVVVFHLALIFFAFVDVTAFIWLFTGLTMMSLLLLVANLVLSNGAFTRAWITGIFLVLYALYHVFNLIGFFSSVD